MTDLAASEITFAPGSTLAEIERWAVATPDAPALLEAGRGRLSYAELSRRADAVAQSLASAGVPRGTAVAVVLADGIQLQIAQLGVSRFHAAAPLNPALTRHEFEACFSALRPSTLIADASAHAAREAAAGLGIPTLDDRSASTGARPYPGIRLIFQTSGTTGKPKLVPLTEENCAARGFRYRDRLELTAADRALSLTPLFLHQGWIASLAQLLAGGSVIHSGKSDSEKFSPEQFLRSVELDRPTWYSASPAVHRAILALLEGASPAPTRSLRFVRSSGAPLSDDLLASLERQLGVPVMEGYGLTETGSIAGTPLHGPRKPGSSGTSTGTEIAIRDADGDPVAPGKPGEITVRGPAVISHYSGADFPSALRNGWFHTGDLGRLDEDGYLFVQGRIHEQINRGGQKVMPPEVDDALLAHPAVDEAAGFGMPHVTLGEEVACAVVLKPGAAASESELRAFAATRLAAFKVPRRIFFVERIPRSASRKPRRTELRELALSAPAEQAAASCQPSPTEARLIAIWQRVLQVPAIGLRDSFFDLGGDSLRASLMLAATETEFQAPHVVTNAAAFFDDPAIATLAAIVDGDGATSDGVIPLRNSGSRIPIFCIPASNEDPFSLRHLSQHLGGDQPFFVLNTSGSHADRASDTVEAAAERSLDALRRAGARAPYVLGGHCYGGVVAFETARRLASEGEPVALVTLFDAPTPGYPKIARQWRKYAGAINRKSTTFRDAWEHAQHLAILLRKKLTAALARRRKPLPLARVVESLVADPAVLGRPCAYEPRSLTVPIVQFLATEAEARTAILEDARTGWRDFALGGFEVRPVPGGHDTLLGQAHAAHLARALREVLEPVNAAARAHPSH